MSAPQRTGRLYLVPTPLDFGCEVDAGLGAALPAQTIAIAAGLTHWITENAKSTRAFLKRAGQLQPLAAPLQEQQITELPRQVHKKGDHDAGGGFDARPLLAAALQDQDIGLVSEAGMPAIADPGSSVVRAAHALGIEVVPLVGPISLMLAGRQRPERAELRLRRLSAGRPCRPPQRIRELEALAQKTGQTQLFIETPYRNAALLQGLLQTLKGTTRLAVACGMTLPVQKVGSALVSDWKKRQPELPLDLPAVFLIGK